MSKPELLNGIPIVAFSSAADWESWLNSTPPASGLWLKIAKKDTGVTTVTYAEALDIALCFGWIDGQKRTYDQTYFLQKFTPRRPKSIWSQRNVEKVAQLSSLGLMRSEGLAEVDAAKADGRWAAAYAPSSSITVPDDFKLALDANPAAKEFFDSLSKTNRYSFLWRIHTAKRAETRIRRINDYISLLNDSRIL